MKKSTFNLQLLLIVGLGIICTFFLFSRDKFVVKTGAETANSDKPQEDKHQEFKLTTEQQTLVDSLNVELKSKPNSIPLLGSLANIYSMANDFEQAGLNLEKAANIESSVTNWNRTGDAYYQGYSLALSRDNIKKFEEKSREAYEKALKIEPNNLYAKTKLAMTYVSSDSPMKAIMMLRQVLADSPNYVPALMNMGALSLQSKQYDKAEVRFNQVLKVDPKNTNASLGLAFSLVELDKIEEAKTLLNDLKKQDLDPVILEEVNKTLNKLK